MVTMVREVCYRQVLEAVHKYTVSSKQYPVIAPQRLEQGEAGSKMDRALDHPILLHSEQPQSFVFHLLILSVKTAL